MEFAFTIKLVGKDGTPRELSLSHDKGTVTVRGPLSDDTATNLTMVVSSGTEKIAFGIPPIVNQWRLNSLAKEEEGKTWSCKACTVKNPTSADMCEVCGTRQKEPEVVAAKKKVVVVADVKSAHGLAPSHTPQHHHDYTRSRALCVCFSELKCQDPKCYRVHGKFDRVQRERFEQTKHGGTASCALALVGACKHGSECDYRHFERVRKLSAFQEQELEKSLKAFRNIKKIYPMPKFV